MIGLALSGGSIKGAFQAGALLALHEKGKLDQVRIAAGTSVGALNAFALSYLNAPELVDIYKSLKKRSDVFKPSWWRLKGLYSTEPVNQLMMEAVRNKPKRFDSVAVCINLETGLQRYAHSDELGYHKYVQASAVIPFFMEPVKGFESWYDGGVFEHTPARWVSEQLYKDDELFVITTRPVNKVQRYELKFPHIFHSLYATVDKRMLDEIFRNDLRYCNDWDIPVIAPEDFIDVGTFEINPDKIKRMIDQGYEQAVKHVS